MSGVGAIPLFEGAMNQCDPLAAHSGDRLSLSDRRRSAKKKVHIPHQAGKSYSTLIRIGNILADVTAMTSKVEPCLHDPFWSPARPGSSACTSRSGCLPAAKR